jgi:hypothetical protein
MGWNGMATSNTYTVTIHHHHHHPRHHHIVAITNIIAFRTLATLSWVAGRVVALGTAPRSVTRGVDVV